MLYFDKNELNNKTMDSGQKTLLKNLQLNNFVNALKSGYLEKFDKTFFGSTKWEEKFCVLCNVGLLYFSDPLLPPSDLFPVIDCKIDKVQRHEEGYADDYFTIRLVYSRKKVIFRCASRTDYESWFKAVMQLQSTDKCGIYHLNCQFFYSLVKGS